jgi:predicted lipoprotein with Yx(FWY)xxD motif
MILVDGQGRTVYEFASDKPGMSNCNDVCLQYWPVVKAPATLPAAVPGVTGKIGEITRSDGTKQLTVNGWPLYTYEGDSAAGSTKGQGINQLGGLWWVVSPNGALLKTTAGASPTSSPSASKSSGGGGGWA